jgi:hypothetical protein
LVDCDVGGGISCGGIGIRWCWCGAVVVGNDRGFLF